MSQETNKEIKKEKNNATMNLDTIKRELEIFREHSRKLKQTYGRISLIRLIVFLGIVLGVLLAMAAQFWWGWLLVVAGVGGFLGLMFYHSSIGEQQNYMERLIRVYECYELRLKNQWHDFEETGVIYLKDTDYVSSDLDVLGKNSLYQMICVAHTPIGKRRLAEVLTGENKEEKRIQQLAERQQAVAELAEKRQYALNFEALAMQCEEQRKGARKTEVGNEEPETAKVGAEKAAFSVVLKIIAIAYPALFVFAILGSVLQWWDFVIVLVLFFAALLASFLMSGYCRPYIHGLLGQSRRIQAHLFMLDALATGEFQSVYLQRLQEEIVGNAEQTKALIRGLRQLERLIAMYNLRYNPIVHWLLSGICMYDLHLAAAAASWERNYGPRLQTGIQGIGEVEMLSSLAVLQRIRDVSYPTLLDSDVPEVQAQQIYHPLLPVEGAVANDIDLKQQPVVITGSNMSGKTTFLRTIGLNLILAYAGAPVCGTGLSVSRMRIFTSMRVTDDVQAGISTFYAEILRVKEMVEYGKSKQPMLCLIDEIFKGTNSADRIIGAETVIRNLTNPHTIAVISTHDFELCRLADNYHFEEFYEKDEIHFDYCLKSGKCTTTNALFLLKMAGLEK